MPSQRGKEGIKHASKCQNEEWQETESQGTSGLCCTHIVIDKQLVKDEKIPTKLINFSFEVFNADRIKNGEVTKVVPLEIGINGHKETLEAAVTDLDRTDMFLGYDWLIKHNLEVN